MEKEFAWLDKLEANARKFDGEEIEEPTKEEVEDEAEDEDED